MSKSHVKLFSLSGELQMSIVTIFMVEMLSLNVTCLLMQLVVILRVAKMGLCLPLVSMDWYSGFFKLIKP